MAPDTCTLILPGRPSHVTSDTNNNYSFTRAPHELDSEENKQLIINNINTWINTQQVDSTISEMANVIMTSKPGIMNVAENFKSTQLQTKNNVSRGFVTLNQIN